MLCGVGSFFRRGERGERRVGRGFGVAESGIWELEAGSWGTGASRERGWWEMGVRRLDVGYRILDIGDGR
jgi:hypothetical protein